MPPRKRIELSEEEKKVIMRLNHPLYSVEFLEEWINRYDDIEVNAVAALQAMGAKGYFDAVRQIIKEGVL